MNKMTEDDLCPVAKQMLGTYEGAADLPPEPLNRELCGRLIYLTEKQQWIMHRALRDSLRIIA